MSVVAFQSNAVAAQPAQETGKKLKLYVVMSPWHPRDHEMGTYESKVWATSDDDAQRELAKLMADCEDSGCESPEEEAAWVEEHLEACEHRMVVLEVAHAVVDDVRELICGPEGEMDAAAKADYESILATLAKYTMAR